MTVWAAQGSITGRRPNRSDSGLAKIAAAGASQCRPLFEPVETPDVEPAPVVEPLETPDVEFWMFVVMTFTSVGIRRVSAARPALSQLTGALRPGIPARPA